MQPRVKKYNDKFLNEIYQKGYKEGVKDTIRKLFSLDIITIEKISEITDLSIEEIKDLTKK